MGAFGIRAICPSTSTADFHSFGYATARTSGRIWVAYNDDETTEILAVTAAGDVLVNPGDAPIATDATDGFLVISGGNGAPTGVPTEAGTGNVPLYYDYANDALYAYNGGWVSVSLS